MDKSYSYGIFKDLSFLLPENYDYKVQIERIYIYEVLWPSVF